MTVPELTVTMVITLVSLTVLVLVVAAVSITHQSTLPTLIRQMEVVYHYWIPIIAEIW